MYVFSTSAAVCLRITYVQIFVGQYFEDLTKNQGACLTDRRVISVDVSNTNLNCVGVRTRTFGSTQPPSPYTRRYSFFRIVNQFTDSLLQHVKCITRPQRNIWCLVA